MRCHLDVKVFRSVQNVGKRYCGRTDMSKTILDVQEIESWTSRMQSERSTTKLYARFAKKEESEECQSQLRFSNVYRALRHSAAGGPRAERAGGGGAASTGAVM